MLLVANSHAKDEFIHGFHRFTQILFTLSGGVFYPFIRVNPCNLWITCLALTRTACIPGYEHQS